MRHPPAAAAPPRAGLRANPQRTHPGPVVAVAVAVAVVVVAVGAARPPWRDDLYPYLSSGMRLLVTDQVVNEYDFEVDGGECGIISASHHFRLQS